MSIDDKNEVVGLVDEYTEWLLGKSDSPLEILLAKPRTLKQRRYLREQIDNMNLIVTGAFPQKHRPSFRREDQDR